MSGKRLFVLFIALLIVSSGLGVRSAEAEPGVAVSTNQIMAGLYAPAQWYSRAHINEVNNASSKKVSIGGIWIEVNESPANVDYMLEEIWSVGATPFVNINVRGTAADIVAGHYDFYFSSLGAAVDSWLARGGNRSVMLAPMPEMNGDWIPYGMDPGNFGAAYRRFVTVANDAGSPGWNVRWVFAPNGWSAPPYSMEDYYPGDELVDLVGMSAYNWGSNVPGARWTTVAETMGGALDEARTFAPEKPFLVSQTASSPYGGDKDAWIREMFTFLANDRNAVGFIYFNIDKERDWTIWQGGFVSAGWKDGMGLESTVYEWPLTDWFVEGPLKIDATPLPIVGRFSDDDRSPFVAEIEWLAGAGITTGCSGTRFCPRDPVTREQMASFLARAQSLPPAMTDYFNDDSSSAHQAAINSIRAASITTGCSATSFCPYTTTTRAHMASFLVRALGLPASTLDYFGDDSGSVHEADINALRQSGITTGCTGTSFCPGAVITREQMAAFLFRSFGS